MLPLALLFGAAAAMFGQQSRSVVGTVTEVRLQRSELAVQSDGGPAPVVRFTADTEFLRVAPGEKSLKSAATITPADVRGGDRVLVTLKPDSPEAMRIVVMPAAEIAKRNEIDQQEWTRNGVSGVVASKSGGQITLRIRSFQGEIQATVITNARTSYRRYAADSVKFADARPSEFGEIRVGDQLRARGRKSEDALSVAASEVVFGSFATKAGTVTAVDALAAAITLKDLETGQPIRVKLTADSQIKRMPEFPPRMALGRSGPAPMALGPRPGGGGPPDISQMLERMPAAAMADLKTGETVVFSSTRSASKTEMTAIMLVANAEALIQMAGRQSRNSEADSLAPVTPMSASSIFGGAGGLELPGMLP